MFSTLKNLGDLAIALQSVSPQSAVAGTLNGASIDRFSHNLPLTCLLHHAVGAISGAPSAMTVSTTIQNAPDNSTWTNYLYDGTHQAVVQALTAANTDAQASFDLTMAQRYVRAVTTISFTGGSTPSVIVAADIVLGGENMPPAI
ncbi:MAG: hypothetical protein ACLPV2_09865 [Steroidobacteraceae bacterium]